MSSIKKLKQAEKAAQQQQEAVFELEALVKSIERCEKTIIDLKDELEAVNQKHQGRKTTQEDINYLTDLLACANKKLNWEKQMASLQKRAPAVLEKITRAMNDPANPPAPEIRAAMLRALEKVQVAMERLDQVKVS